MIEDVVGKILLYSTTRSYVFSKDIQRVISLDQESNH